MRRIGYGFSLAAAATLAMLNASPLGGQFMRMMDGAPRKTGNRRKTGELYPFSSARQNARYARQIAAGQLRMTGVTGPTAAQKRRLKAGYKLALSGEYGKFGI